MKRLFYGVILSICMLFVFSNFVYADEECIWMAGDTEFDSIKNGIISSDITIKNLTISKGVQKSSSIKMYKGDKLEEYFCLPNYGSKDNGYIKFYVRGQADIYIIGNSNNNGEARNLKIYTAKNNKTDTISINEPSGYKYQYRQGDGQIYLYAESMPIRIYGIAIRYYPYDDDYDFQPMFTEFLREKADKSFSSNVESYGTKVYATPEKTVSIVSKNLYDPLGYLYSYGLNLVGSGSSTYRTVSQRVLKDADVYVTAKSNYQSGRKLYVTNKYYQTIAEPIIVTDKLATYRFKYTGDGDEIMFRSEDSGITIYDIGYVYGNKNFFDNRWNIYSDDNFKPQILDRYTKIKGLTINTDDNYKSSIKEVHKGDAQYSPYYKAINLSTEGILSFDVAKSDTDEVGYSKRKVSITAEAESDGVDLAITNEYGYIYKIFNITKDISTYSFQYDGIGDTLYIEPIASNPTFVNIYSITTNDSDNFNELKSCSKNITVKSGEDCQLYFGGSQILKPDIYTYTIEYDPKMVTFKDIGLIDGSTNYGNNGVEILGKGNSSIRFKIKNEGIHWSGIFTSVVFTGNADGDTSIKFYAR